MTRLNMFGSIFRDRLAITRAVKALFLPSNLRA